jgi:DNA-binding NtrC family response regulator
MMPSGAHLMMLIDDEPAQQRLVSALASRSGWRTAHAATGEIAIAMLGTREGMALDAILIDQATPGHDCVELIAELRLRRPSLPILLLTAYNSMATVVETMRAGATDFIVKPIAPDRLVAALEATICPDVPRGELRPLTEKDAAPLGFDEVVGSDPAFRNALAIAAKAARSKVPVLIEGEHGVGKDMVAQAIHLSSAREKRPFIRMNCAAIPANLIESELFGHERGAFAGAFTRHDGKLLEADGGTLMLDEIEALPFDLHVKLLRAIQTGEVHPIGARGFREVDVRIIAAANRNLLDDIMAMRFREDLYYRLATVHIMLPPLRDRIADMPALARHLLTRMARHHGMRGLGITDDALALLGEYGWPENIRQIQSVLFRAAIACDRDALTAADFSEIASRAKTTGSVRRATSEAGVTLYKNDGHMRSLEEIEADVIRLAIGHYRGRMTEVARRLNIGRSTLYRKLAELGISDVA